MSLNLNSTSYLHIQLTYIIQQTLLLFSFICIFFKNILIYKIVYTKKASSYDEALIKILILIRIKKGDDILSHKLQYHLRRRA